MVDAAGLPGQRALPIAAPAWIFAALVVSVAIAMLPPQLLGALLVLTTATALALWRPAWSVCLLVATVPLQRVGEASGLLSMTLTRAALLGLAVGWLVLLAHGRIRLRFDTIGGALCLYVAILALSIAQAQDVHAWAGECYRWTVMLVVYLIARSTMRPDRDGTALLIALGVGVVGCAAAASWQVLTHAGPPSFTVDGWTRAYAAFGEPNPLAMYLEIGMLPVAAFLFWRLSRATTWRQVRLTAVDLCAFIAVLCGCTALLLTQSRGGVIGLASGGLVVILTSRGWLRRFGLVGIALAVICLLLWGGVSPLTQRLTSFGGAVGGDVQVTAANFAARERLAHWGAALQMWREHPLLGVGAGNFDAAYRSATTDWRFRIPRGHAHSAYLQSAAQAGTAGLLAYLFLLGAVIRAARAAGSASCWPTAALAVTLALAVHGVFDYVHVLSLGIPLIVIWAMVPGTTTLEVTGA